MPQSRNFYCSSLAICDNLPWDSVQCAIFPASLSSPRKLICSFLNSFWWGSILQNWKKHFSDENILEYLEEDMKAKTLVIPPQLSSEPRGLNSGKRLLTFCWIVYQLSGAWKWREHLINSSEQRVINKTKEGEEITGESLYSFWYV